MVKRGRSEVLKWVAVVVVVANLMIWEASWLRKRGDSVQESHEAVDTTNDAALRNKCPPAERALAQMHCPSIDCTKVDLQRCSEDVRIYF